MWSRARPPNVDDGSNISGASEVYGARASCALLTNLRKQNSLFYHAREIKKICRLFSTPRRPNVLYHTSSQFPPHISGHCVDTVTLAGVGAPNERSPLTSYDADIVVCQSMSVEDLVSPRFGLYKFFLTALSRRSLRNFCPRNYFVVFV